VTTLDELAARFHLGPAQTTALDRYVTLLLEWREGRVTGLRRREDVVEQLLGDALALLDAVSAGVSPLERVSRPPHRLLDLGSGGGVPGVPLAVALPQLSVVLLDSVRKKCRFLDAVVSGLELGDRVRVACARSETYTATGGEGREAFDLVTVRAVGALAEVVELAAPALAEGGRLLALKTRPAAADERGPAESAARACGLVPLGVWPLPLSPLRNSVCVVFEKHGPTPGWLPRRPGSAGRRPPPAR
jgi:16S rRNA (guanine527-N7)-methyltransferase